MEGDSIKTLEARCRCGSVHFTVGLTQSQLPLPVHLCHCSLCRYRSGAPCIFHTPLPRGIKLNFVAPSVKKNMARYDAGGTLSQWLFCSGCGCHIASTDGPGTFVVSSSIFQDSAEDTFKMWRHIYSKSTGDGGIACILTQVGDRDLQDWNPPDHRPDAKLVEPQSESGDDGNDRLRAQCHCGGVSFTLSRPSQATLEDEYLKNYVSPLDKTKWLASLDACDDCRLVNGTHLVGWTFFPLAICEPPIKRDLRIGTSKTYESSPGMLRSFCGTCGATIFFSCDDRCPSEERQVVDLATGILRAPEGAMAHKWLTWRTRTAFINSGKRFDLAFARALGDAMKRWTVECYGRELNFDIN